MKTRKIIKKLALTLAILMFVLLLLSSNLVNDNSSSMKGSGVECFKQCSNICISKTSKVMSFAAVENKCSCTCFNEEQIMFNIK